MSAQHPRVGATTPNVPWLLDAVEGDVLVRRPVNRAYDDIVASGGWKYRSFGREIEDTSIDRAPGRDGLGPTGWLAYKLLRARGVIFWKGTHRQVKRGSALWRSVARSLRSTVAPIARKTTSLAS